MIGSVRGEESTNAVPNSLEAWLEKIPKGNGSVRDFEYVDLPVAEGIKAQGARAIPALIDRLSSSETNTRAFAAWVLQDLDPIPESELGRLIVAGKGGNRLIIPVITRFNDPRAIAFLVESLERWPAHDDVLSALERSPQETVSGIIRLFRQPRTSGDCFVINVASVFRQLGPAASIAVQPMIELANDQTVFARNRPDAVYALGALSQRSPRVVAELKALAAVSTGLVKDAAESALVDTDDPAAIDIIVRKLRTQDSPYLRHRSELENYESALQPASRVVVSLLDRLREMGRGAGKAGGAVVELLADPDWQVRLVAAETLGYLDYEDGVGALRKLLFGKDDWELVCRAAESLARLKAQSALSDLETVASAHWFPPVREWALRCMEVIEGKTTLEALANRRPDRSEDETRVVSLPTYWKSDPALLTPDQLRANKYTVHEKGRNDDDAPMVHTFPWEPVCGLRIGGGMLLGGNRGEFGGELVFRSSAGDTVLFDDNIQGLCRMPFGVVAVTGLAHLVGRQGMLYLIDERNGATPNARAWKRLPGAPRQFGILENGDLFVACTWCDIVISAAGEISAAPGSLKPSRNERSR